MAPEARAWVGISDLPGVKGCGRFAGTLDDAVPGAAYPQAIDGCGTSKSLEVGAEIILGLGSPYTTAQR